MNSTVYSCYDGTGLNYSSVTVVYWDTEPHRGSALANAVIILCFIIVGVPSNLLILASILRQQLYREPTYILLLNLALADLLICLLFMPFTVVSGLAGSFIFGATDLQRCKVCQFAASCLTIFGLLTIHFLSLLSLDRFLFIRFPLKYYQLVTCTRSAVACGLCWILCIALSVPPLLGFGDIMFDLRVAVCSMDPDGNNTVTTNIYYLVFVAAEICIPLGLLVVTNCWIVYIVQKQMRKIYSARKEQEDSLVNFRTKLMSMLKSSKSWKQIKLVKVFGAILIANIITWIPFFIRVVGTAIFEDIFPDWFHVVITVTIVSFAVIHPVIQAWLVPELRKELSYVFNKLHCCHRLQNSSFSQNKQYNCLCHHSNSCFLDCFDYLNVSLLTQTEEVSLA